MEDTDVQLQLKKRARRRLVGAVTFVSFVAVILPLVMDHEPRQAIQDVEIRIPGQDEKPFVPKFAVSPVEKPPVRSATEPPQPATVAPQADIVVDTPPTARVIEIVKDKPADKAEDKPAEKSPEKSSAKPEKPVEKPADKSGDAEAKRAAAILTGQAATAPVAKSGEYLILIGAFSNDANVKNLKKKLNEEGIRSFTEPLDTPQGKKTRVRAGPFPSREAAEKALEKMRKIGVSGVVSAK
jgi:DedD protein